MSGTNDLQSLMLLMTIHRDMHLLSYHKLDMRWQLGAGQIFAQNGFVHKKVVDMMVHRDLQGDKMHVC